MDRDTVPASPLLDHCPPSLPAAWYRDPAHHAREIREVWGRSWVHVGRAADLPPMTLRRVTVAGESVILVRDREGQARAFLNVCRHRGAELCGAETRPLATPAIVCPYHRWAYGLDGRLAATPHVSVPPDFRREDHGLVPVALAAWRGFLLACLDAAAPPDPARVPDPAPDTLANWPLEDLVSGRVETRRIACNWKVFWENYSECLHCPGIHPALSARVPVYRRGYMAPEEDPRWTPETPPEPALAPGAASWTRDGKACGPVFPGLTAAERAAGHVFVTLWPSMYVVAHVDHVRTVTLRPTGPAETELRAEWLFPAETLAAPGFDLDNATGLALQVIEEDGAAAEMNQRGLASARFGRGVLMPQEYEIRRFHLWLRDRIGLPE